MTALRLGAFLHVSLAILVTGYALFWVVMAVTLGREEPTDSRRLLGVVGAARWPPVGPHRFRPPLTSVGWGILAAVAGTGVVVATLYGGGLTELLVSGGPWGGAMRLKLGGFMLLLACQVALAIRPSRPAAYLNGAATLAILLLSAFLRH